MKLKIFVDKTKEEEILIYVHEKNGLVEEIERLVSENNFELIGYKDNEAQKLSLLEVNCFICENNKVFALTDEKLAVRLRLYQIEDLLDDNFVRINQSCIANIRKIEKTQADFSGALTVVFKNGYRDYISRRNLKKVKERLGVKL
jgi:DNA-binding LytR/AlgR family response regulator